MGRRLLLSTCTLPARIEALIYFPHLEPAGYLQLRSGLEAAISIQRRNSAMCLQVVDIAIRCARVCSCEWKYRNGCNASSHRADLQDVHDTFKRVGSRERAETSVEAAEKCEPALNVQAASLRYFVGVTLSIDLLAAAKVPPQSRLSRISCRCSTRVYLP